MIVIHPKWIEQAGAGDIARHFQTRGFQVWGQMHSKYMRVERIPTTPLDETLALFRPQPQTRR